MGGSISKEERAARKFLNDRIFARIQEYIDRRESLYVNKLLLHGKKLVREKPGKIMASKGELCSQAFVLVEGAVKVNGLSRRRPALYCSECLFGVASPVDITIEEPSVILLLTKGQHTLYQRPHIMQIFTRYAPIFPAPLQNNHFRDRLRITAINQRQGEEWYQRAVAASLLDRYAKIYEINMPYNVYEIDFRDELVAIIDKYKETPVFITVPSDKEEYMVLEEKGKVPERGWILLAGKAEAVDPSDEHDQAEILLDSDDVIITENNAILQMETTVEYRLKPGSMAVGIGRKTLAAMQFLKTFSLDHMESTRLADQAEILELKPGERIDIDGYFRGIIYSGKINLVALAVGRASEFETERRTVVQMRSSEQKVAENSITGRKSCRIATALESAFERHGPYDDFIAVAPTVCLISTGVDQNQGEHPHLPAITESEEDNSPDI